MRRLFFTTAVDHHRLNSWGPLADALRRDARAACGGDVAVEVGDGPVWGYGVDVEETLATLEEMRLDRAVRIDLWSSIVFYSAICITLGSQIKRPERRALEKKLRKTLRGEKLLHTVKGPYDDESALVFGYSMWAAANKADVEHLLFPFESPLYLGERWLVQDADESLAEQDFSTITEVAPGLVTFFARHGDAEEAIWRHCSGGEGLIACYPDDPALAKLIQRFHDFVDLRVLLVDKPSAGLRVSIDRCHQDDSLVVAYAPAGPPEIEAPYLFLI